MEDPTTEVEWVGNGPPLSDPPCGFQGELCRFHAGIEKSECVTDLYYLGRFVVVPGRVRKLYLIRLQTGERS